MRQFVCLTLSATIPEVTTIMNLRHLLEKHQLAPAILAVINGYLMQTIEAQGGKAAKLALDISDTASYQVISNTVTAVLNTDFRHQDAAFM